MKTKTFHVSDILSVTTGRLVSTRHMEWVYDILNFLTGCNLFTHQIPRACEACASYLIQTFPELSKAGEPSNLAKLDAHLNYAKARNREASCECALWVKWMCEPDMCGLKKEYELAPLPQGQYESKNPLLEAIEIMNPLSNQTTNSTKTTI